MSVDNKKSFGKHFFHSLLELRRLSVVERQNPAVQFLQYCSRNVGLSNSQLFQDLFVLFMLKGKRDGYFVEFGACDGVEFSNSLVLEKKLGWQGLLAEPARGWHAALKKNRSATIETRCVYSETGKTLEFRETDWGPLSTISSYSDSDQNRNGRKGGQIYSVQTVSLVDMLKSHNAPPHINYLSIDTEGSELAILEAFDFSEYVLDVASIEHNFTGNREPIRQLMKKHGYANVFPALSSFDDWFVHERILQEFIE